MTWFKMDDSFYAHPKVLAAPLEAIGLWARAAAWCAQQLTDGRVPTAALPMLGGTTDIADTLVAVGLWERDGIGYVFHDWADYQPDAATVRATREAKSTGGAQGNHARWHAARGVVVADCEWCAVGSRRTSDRSSDGVSESHANPPVPDPYPTQETPTGVSSAVVVLDAPRADVTHLLDTLDSAIERNGSKRPMRSRSNLDAMRLLLDRDGRSQAEVEAVIQWCQSDGFWRSNILSATTLRKQFDRLRLNMQRAGSGGGAALARDARERGVVAAYLADSEQGAIAW